jgi:hypothetical protein
MQSEVIVSFKTDRFGYFQIGLKHNEEEDFFKLDELANEPDLNMFSDDDVDYIRNICLAVWVIIHKNRKFPERFE